ncbi:MAG: ATP-binding cassette domain-containing protein, partial [Bacteroidota bacterium]
MSNILKTYKLTKNYGKLTAVNGLDLEIKEGQIFGLLGPNGSGKTTTLGMILGVTAVSGGSFEWFNGESDHHTRKKIGAILEQPIFYPGYTAVENLKIVAKIKGIGLSRMEKVLRLVDLWDRRNDRFSGYSLGMKQRLAIASAMLCDPQALILDEPTNGLDPEGIAQIREIIKTIGDTGKSIILASHLLDEVQKVCTHYCVLRSGNLIHSGSVKADMGDERRIIVNVSQEAQLPEFLSQLEGVSSTEDSEDGILCVVNDDFTLESFSRKVTDSGLTITHLSEYRKTLEEQFL